MQPLDYILIPESPYVYNIIDISHLGESIVSQFPGSVQLYTGTSTYPDGPPHLEGDFTVVVFRTEFELSVWDGPGLVDITVGPSSSEAANFIVWLQNHLQSLPWRLYLGNYLEIEYLPITGSTTEEQIADFERRAE